MKIDINYAKNMILSKDVYNPSNSIMLIEEGTVITEELIDKLKQHGVTSIDVYHEEKETLPENLLIDAYSAIRECNINEVVHLASIIEEISNSVTYLSIDMSKYTNDKFKNINPLLLSILDIAPAINIVKYYNGTVNKTHQIAIKDIIISVMLQDIGYLCSSQKNYFNSIKSTFIADYERLLLEYPNLPANGFDEYQKELHPVYSYYLIKDHQLGDSCEKGVLMHNEMYQYSNQGALKTNLKDEEVRFPKAAMIAMIIKAVDSYNKLLFNGNRVNPEYPFESVPKYLEVLVANGTLSPKFTNILKEVVPLYPIGSLVKLSDGTIAQVVKYSKSNILQPDIIDLNGEPISYSEDIYVAEPIENTEEYKRPKHL